MSSSGSVLSQPVQSVTELPTLPGCLFQVLWGLVERPLAAEEVRGWGVDPTAWAEHLGPIGMVSPLELTPGCALPQAAVVPI